MIKLDYYKFDYFKFLKMSFKDNFLNLIPELFFQITNTQIPNEGTSIMKYGILTFNIDYFHKLK